MESIILDEFETIFIPNKTKFLVGGVNIDNLNPILNKYILDKKPLLDIYIGKLTGNIKKELKVSDKNTKYDKIFINTIISTIDPDYIYNLCLHHFLIIYTYENTEDEKNTLLVPVSVAIGKKLVTKYFNTLREMEYKADPMKEKSWLFRLS